MLDNDKDKKSKDTILKDNLSHNIAFYRHSIGYTQESLAEKLNSKSSTLAGWEQGRTMPSIEVLFRMCELFGVDLYTLCGVSRDVEIEDDNENALVRGYRLLNSEGKKRLDERLEELREVPKYRGLQ